MKFEHFALNVPDVHAHVQWYLEHLGLKIARELPDPPYMTFLADDTGRTIVELYSNPKAPYPDYKAAHPLLFHIAFVAADARAARLRLEKAGATLFAEDALPDGSTLIMMRDPWGVPLQFCQRAKPFPMP
jgi:glyoxylase I family protein